MSGLTPRQEGERLGELCTQKAEEQTEFDRVAAGQVICQHLLNVGGAVSGEVLVDVCIAAGFVPHDARAFGAVFQKLSREKKIVSVGYTIRVKGHGTPGARLWQLADEGEI